MREKLKLKLLCSLSAVSHLLLSIMSSTICPITRRLCRFEALEKRFKASVLYNFEALKLRGFEGRVLKCSIFGPGGRLLAFTLHSASR
jgi:hypothetical protein